MAFFDRLLQAAKEEEESNLEADRHQKLHQAQQLRRLPQQGQEGHRFAPSLEEKFAESASPQYRR
jgi:hypothetical protein